MRKLILVIFAVFAVSSVYAAENAANMRVYFEPTGKIDRGIYAQFLEHIYKSVWGGLDAELCLDGDFEQKRNNWRKYIEGNAVVSNVTEKKDSFQGSSSKCIEVKAYENGVHGIAYRNIVISKGWNYQCRIALRGEGGPVVVRLVNRDKIIDEVIITKNATRDWQIFAFELSSSIGSERAKLAIGLKGNGKIYIDSVGMRPVDKNGDPMFFRPDLLEAVKALEPSFIRWPGGFFAERYRWKDAVGPVFKRPRRKDETWDYRDPNWFGTDEFIQLCRETGAEPLICFNIGNHEPRKEMDAYISEALDWIEYCNGDTSTVWGKKRAENGHSQPYNVKYWEIGNEVWFKLNAGSYVVLARKFCQAIRERYPDLILLVCGGCGTDSGWNQGILRNKKLSSNFEMISVHYYGEGKDYLERMVNAVNYVQFLRSTAGKIKNSRSPETKIAVTEWNLMSTGLDSGLWAGIFLIGCEELCEYVTLTTPALFLRNTDAPAWDNALINFDPLGWFPGGSYLVVQLFSRNYAPTLLKSEVKSKTLSRIGGNDLKEIYAAAGTDGENIIIKAVNVNPEEEISLKIAVEGVKLSGSGRHFFITGSSPEQRNSIKEPDLISIRENAVRTSQSGIVVMLPKHSVNLITVPIQK